MANAVILPKLGQTMETGTIVKWHKKEGDPVKKGDVLFEIETDKAVLEAESFFEGTLLKILHGEGQTVPVNVTVGWVGKPGEKLPDAPPPPAAAPAPASAPAPTAVTTPAPTARPAAKPAEPTPEPVRPAAPPPPPAPAARGRLLISPRAKALARSAVIDPARITGSGPGGRIVEKDVQAYLDANGYADLRISPAAKNLAAKEGLDLLTLRGTGDVGRITVTDVERALRERPVRMSKMRQVIAQRLTQSFTSTPHFFVTVSVDMSPLLGLRKDLKARGIDYSVTDFILEAVVLALQETPAMNSNAQGDAVRWNSAVHLGMAVSLPEGLVVPVLRNAGELSLRELHDAAKALAEKARTGRLLPDEMTGSTFTVSNMGMLNVENFTAIINPGEAGILAVSSTQDTPVARNGKVEIRAMMKITLSSDHRLIDGAVAAGFVNTIKRKLEDVEAWKRLI